MIEDSLTAVVDVATLFHDLWQQHAKLKKCWGGAQAGPPEPCKNLRRDRGVTARALQNLEAGPARDHQYVEKLEAGPLTPFGL